MKSWCESFQGPVAMRIEDRGTSLVVQWLRLYAPSAGGLDSIPGQGTRSHMPQLKSLHCQMNKNKLIHF